MSQIVGRYKKGTDVTADSALSEGLTAVYRNDPRLGAILSRARLLAGEASFRHETRPRKLKSIKYSSGGSSHHEHLSAHDDQGTTLPGLSLEAVRLQTLQRN